MTVSPESGFAALLLLVRVCIAAPFLVSGIHKTLWYRKAIDEFKQARVPMIRLTLPLTIGLHLLASLCLVGGVFILQAALSLAGFTLLATFWVFPFWKKTGSQRLDESRIALANLGLAGGLLLLLVTGPGPYVLF